MLLAGDLLYWDAFSSSEKTHMVYLTALGLRCRGVMYDNNDVMRVSSGPFKEVAVRPVSEMACSLEEEHTRYVALANAFNSLMRW